jgi:hypothetical protein
MQRRPRQADAFLFRPAVPRSIIWSVCAREVSEGRLPCDWFYAGLSSAFPALHLLIGIGWCNLFGS